MFLYIRYKKIYIHGANENVRPFLRNETAHEQDYVMVLPAILCVNISWQKIYVHGGNENARPLLRNETPRLTNKTMAWLRLVGFLKL